MNTFSNKTELRNILKCVPRLVTKLTPEYMDNATLSSKEWILCISRIVKDKKITLPFELKDYLEVESTVCGLKESNTKPFKKAVKHLKV